MIKECEKIDKPEIKLTQREMCDSIVKAVKNRMETIGVEISDEELMANLTVFIVAEERRKLVKKLKKTTNKFNIKRYQDKIDEIDSFFQGLFDAAYTLSVKPQCT